MSKPVIIVVGAGPGIGAATARRFAAAGYDVGLLARDAQRVEALAESLEKAGANVGWAAVDVADRAALDGALRRMTEHTGRLDVLLYNPANLRPVRVSELTAEDLLSDLAVGAAHLLTAVQAVLPILRQQHTGTILATGGGVADSPSPTMGSLGVQKAALRNLVQTLAADLSGEGIHVATLTIHSLVQEGTASSPDRVAQLYAELVEETATDPKAWRTVIDLF